MGDQVHQQELPRGGQRRRRKDRAATPARTLAAAVARTLGNVTLVVVLYYVLPLDRGFGWGTVAELLGGLAVVAVLATWQVRSVMRSPYPALRATETLALTVPLFLVLFAATYQAMASSDPATFNQPLTRTDTLYFVVTVFATVGFGDIVPVSQPARVLTMVQMIGDLVLIGLVIRAMLSAVQRGREAAAASRDEAPHPPPGQG